ncbi:MAG: hypothetical protein R3D80_13120 [Paracoccaceae bacterium]
MPIDSEPTSPPPRRNWHAEEGDDRRGDGVELPGHHQIVLDLDRVAGGGGF